MGMTKEEAIEFITQSVKSDVDMALVADAIKALEQEPNKVCDWFKQYIDIPSNTVLIEFSDGTSKRVKRGGYLANVENDLRRMMTVQIERESYEDAIRPNQEPRWIPVSERLPEERDWYLAVFKEIDTGYQLIPRVADYIGYGENKWQIIDEDGVGGVYRFILECVAWMPLPKPYKPESEEEE